MKNPFVPGSSPPVNRGEAWGCFTANLALPGSGSLVAGRALAGYCQMALTLLGMATNLLTGVRFIFWCLANWTAINNPPPDDPLGGMVLLWQAIRWPLAGICIFAFALVWALLTSVKILAEHPKNPAPPRIAGYDARS